MSGLARRSAGWALAASVWLGGPAAASTLMVTSWGGGYAEAQRAAFHDPFSAVTGVRVVQDEWGGDLARVRSMVARRAYNTHLIDAEGDEVVVGCAAGLLEPIDYARLSFAPSDLIPGAAHECGVATIAWSMVLAFDRAQLRGQRPEGWRDFWDLERYPGRRGLPNQAQGTLEIALMADGVPVDEVYAALRTPQGVARALTKLEDLREAIVWWEFGSQAPRLLLDEAVTMTATWNGRIAEAISKGATHVEVVWRGQLMHFDYWVIPRHHPGATLAHEFIDFASRPERQAAFTRYFPYGPVHPRAFDHIALELRPLLPTAPENLAEWLRVEPSFWSQHAGRLSERFAAWRERRHAEAAGDGTH